MANPKSSEEEVLWVQGQPGLIFWASLGTEGDCVSKQWCNWLVEYHKKKWVRLYSRPNTEGSLHLMAFLSLSPGHWNNRKRTAVSLCGVVLRGTFQGLSHVRHSPVTPQTPSKEKWGREHKGFSPSLYNSSTLSSDLNINNTDIDLDNMPFVSFSQRKWHTRLRPSLLSLSNQTPLWNASIHCRSHLMCPKRVLIFFFLE